MGKRKRAELVPAGLEVEPPAPGVADCAVKVVRGIWWDGEKRRPGDLVSLPAGEAARQEERGNVRRILPTHA
jgi:hypothetical protein